MPLKTLALIKESELGDGMMLQVPFSAPDSPEYKSANGPQVLLSRLGDTIHATSAYCTHYGAPLVKGILTADGKVTCPWHGACFRVESGDIEDFPAPSGIHSFKAWVEDGMVWVRADEGVCLKETSARPPKLSTMGFDAVGKGTVIVGGGAGALGCAESLRENGYKYPITILSSEPHAPIDRTKLSKSPGGDVAKLTLLTPATLKIKMGVNLRIGVAVTGIDVERRRVWVGKDTSRESIAYDKLVLATGGVPRVLPVQGVWKDPSTKELQPNVYTLRTHADSVKIEGAVGRTTAPAKHMVIVGSSFIGMELVAALSKRNLKISVIGMESVPFEAVLGKEVGRGLMEYHLTQHVKFYMSSKVDRFEVGEGGVCGVVVRQDPSAASSSSAPATKEVKEAKDKEAEGQDKESEIKDQDAAVTNADGSITLKADFVVMAVGVRPATDYLREAAPSRTSSSESKATEEGAPATASALAAGALESGPKVGIGAESGMPSQASAVASGAAPAASSAPSAASSGSAPSPIPLQPDGSVKVDEYLRVLGSDGGVLGGGSVFGIGDIAQYPDLETGTYRRVEHWNVAGNHGRAVGATIAGKGEPFNKLPVFWSAQGQQLRYCGYGVGFDDVIVKGDVGALKFVAYYVKEGKVVAVSSMQHDPICAKAAQLMRLGKMPGGEAVRGGVDIMKIDISSQGSLV